ncbi:seipin [Aspergillus lucknowensis]|uniref:Adipose-regulatory protein-domain-containing protein n=1 Tax=Aspergillus lucknowensis TaxID=176173 RepID=A0ABR4LUX5_9EURO
MGSDKLSDEGLDDGPPFISRVTNTLLAPLRPFVSRTAVTAYVGTVLFVVTAICMVFVSVFAYGLFYYNFIPQVGLERIVYLQFGEGHPWGTATLDSGLVSLQPYDVSVELELPRTPSNLAAGNFMLDLTLLSQPPTSESTGENASPLPISHSRRPAILSYTSPLIDFSKKVTFMPLYILGWRRETERLVIQMMERAEFSRGALDVPGSLRLELHSRGEMQVYGAKVAFRANLSGLRYSPRDFGPRRCHIHASNMYYSWVMYQWKITSFFVFTFMFWSVSMFSFSLSWIILPCFLSPTPTGGGDGEVKPEDELESQTLVKQEPDEALSLPEASSIGESHTKRELESEEDGESDSSPEQDPGPLGARAATLVASASGRGTATKYAEAAGLQQRRSHASGNSHA